MTKQYDASQYLNEKTYNDKLPGSGEVIAPFVVTLDQVEYEHMNKKNLKTWTLKGGRKVLVAFTICKSEEFSNMMKIFNYMADSHKDFEDESILSLDQMMEDAQDPEKQCKEPTTKFSTEDLFLASVEIDDLITAVTLMDAKSGAILDLLRNDLKKGDILKQLGLGKSQGYEDIKKAQRMAKAVYYQTL